jgi:NAD(P)-dependent dehydrogenase (short-subunit alcohol dehydrogenase family)
MDYEINGKVTVITGGSSGIGKAIAKAFTEEGAIAVINGRDQAKIDKACEEIGPNARGISADLTNPADCEKLNNFAKESGPVEFLVNNIGIFEVMDFFEITDENWYDYFNVNVMTGVRMSRLILKDMLANNSGSILFIASDAAVKSIPWMVHYSMTKTAQLGVSRALAEITKGTDVRVNTIMPGPSATESVMEYFGDIAKDKGTSTAEVIANYFKEDEPSSLHQRLIDPSFYGRAAIAIMTNPAMNGTAQRCEGGIVRACF